MFLPTPNNSSIVIYLFIYIHCLKADMNVKLNNQQYHTYSGQNFRCSLWSRYVMLGSVLCRQKKAKISHFFCDMSIRRVTGRKRVFYLFHLRCTFTPKFDKVTIQIFGWCYLNVCDHNPSTLQTDRQTDRQHTTAILCITSNPAHQGFYDDAVYNPTYLLTNFIATNLTDWLTA